MSAMNVDSDGTVHGSNLRQHPDKVQPLKIEKQLDSRLVEYIAEVKSAFENSPHKYDEFQVTLKSMKSGKFSPDEAKRRLMILFKGHPELVLGLNYLMPREKIDTKEATEELIRKITNRFLDNNPAACRILVKRLNGVIEGEVFDYDGKFEVAALLQEHPDLLVDFLSVLASRDDFVSIGDKQSTPIKDVKSQEVNSVAALPLPQQPCTDDDRMMVDSVAHSDNDCRNGDKDCPSGSGSASADGYVAEAGEKEADKEFDPSKFEVCTPSYRLLPEDCPVASSSWRYETDLQVLNDQCMSFSAATQYRSSKQRNPYEEMLFRCEDDLYEVDMLMESLNATTKNAEALLKMIKDQMTKTDCSISVRDHLNPKDLRCIEKLYRKRGADVVRILRKDPVVTLPIILGRLKQKQKECAEQQCRFKRASAQAFKRNHLKALDIGYNRLSREGVVSPQ